MYNEIIVLGVIISIVFTELTSISSCGLIVTGYFALALKTPQRIIYTLVVSIITYCIIKGISKIAIIYGRRRFALSIILAFCVDFILSIFLSYYYNPGLIGIIVPGLIVNEWLKQGIIKSTLALMITVGITASIMCLFNIPVL